MFEVKIARYFGPYACGANCLKMLLGYYGVEVDHETLYHECNTRMSGCSGKDLLLAGRLHGLDMSAWKMDADELMRQDRPAIIWWMRCHWVLFCGMSEGTVCIADPDLPVMQHYSAADFLNGYSGVALFNGEPQDLPSGEGVTMVNGNLRQSCLRGSRASAAL